MKKKRTICRFTNKCAGCTSQAQCISPTSLISSKRKYLNKLFYRYQQPTPEMLKGKQKHEELQESIPTLAELTFKRFQRQLYNAKQIKLSEAILCSPLYGIHGYVDVLNIQFTKDNKIYIKIDEIKPFYTKNYLLQVCAYGLILSDPNCLIGYHATTPRSKRLKRIMNHLYPKTEFNLDISLILQFYLQKNPFEFTWMQNNNLTEVSQGIKEGLMRMRKDRLRLHKVGLYYLEHLPPCKNCPRNELECSLYEYCGKVSYEKQKKEKQLYFGKQKLLIKTFNKNHKILNS